MFYAYFLFRRSLFLFIILLVGCVNEEDDFLSNNNAIISEDISNYVSRSTNHSIFFEIPYDLFSSTKADISHLPGVLFGIRDLQGRVFQGQPSAHSRGTFDREIDKYGLYFKKTSERNRTMHYPGSKWELADCSFLYHGGFKREMSLCSSYIAINDKVFASLGFDITVVDVAGDFLCSFHSYIEKNITIRGEDLKLLTELDFCGDTELGD